MAEEECLVLSTMGSPPAVVTVVVVVVGNEREAQAVATCDEAVSEDTGGEGIAAVHIVREIGMAGSPFFVSVVVVSSSSRSLFCPVMEGGAAAEAEEVLVVEWSAQRTARSASAVVVVVVVLLLLVVAVVVVCVHTFPSLSFLSIVCEGERKDGDRFCCFPVRSASFTFLNVSPAKKLHSPSHGGLSVPETREECSRSGPLFIPRVRPSASRITRVGMEEEERRNSGFTGHHPAGWSAGQDEEEVHMAPLSPSVFSLVSFVCSSDRGVSTGGRWEASPFSGSSLLDVSFPSTGVVRWTDIVCAAVCSGRGTVSSEDIFFSSFFLKIFF